MMRTAIGIIDRDLLQHGAVLAWRALVSPSAPPPNVIEVLKEKMKACVYRLEWQGKGGRRVIAKRCLMENAVLERFIYKEILPQLPLPALRYHGFVEDENPQFGWLFMEDAGDECFSDNVSKHRFVVSRWLGILHTSAAGVRRVASLPDRGPCHYNAVLESGLQKIQRNLGNPILCAGDLELLNAILLQYAAVSARWHEIEDFCNTMPRTLVHGDFKAKNTRIRVCGPELVLFPLDWEMAGRAVPCADLERVLDLHAYWSTVTHLWPHLGVAELERLRYYGKIFRLLAAIEWASRGLEYEWVKRPMACLHVYRDYLSDTLQALAWE